MKQFLLPLSGLISAALTASGQSPAPGSSPSTSQKVRVVHIAPKPARVVPKLAPQTAPATINPPVAKQASVIAYSQALGRYQHARHSRDWWKRHFTTIVFVGGGYYYFDAGYWFPAWGYDPNYESFDYDGPIFTYGNLLPDQVIVNVQRALQQLGYFAGPVSGSLSPATRRAISSFQQDNGLEANGVVDGPTVSALGLI